MRTYGTIRRDGKHWVIQCEPHVMMRFKRSFSKISTGAFGSFLISDSVNTCRDLEWFLTRYPLEYEQAGDAAYLIARAQEYRNREDIVTSLLQGTLGTHQFQMGLPPR